MIPFRPVAHAPPAGESALMLVAHALAGVGSGLLLALGVAAFSRRQSRSYLLVVLALAGLLGRTALSGLTLAGFLPAGYHHLGEHVLDAMVATFLLGAIYYARTGDQPTLDRGEDG